MEKILTGDAVKNKLLELRKKMEANGTIRELPKEKHPFFLGVQFHPEYKSRPLDPHPIFVEFVKTCKIEH